MTNNIIELAPYRSQFVSRAQNLNNGVLAALSIDFAILQICELVVSISSLVTDTTDRRSWQDRLNEAVEGLEQKTLIDAAEKMQNAETLASAEAWARKVRTKDYKLFARRLLGAAEYYRLERAAYQDVAVVTVGVRKAVRAAMPFLIAWEDAIAVMSPGQLSKLASIDLLGLNFTKILHHLDSFLGDRVLPAFPEDVILPLASDVLDLSEMAEMFRAKVSSGALSQLTRVNQPLVRKLSGARDALIHSADGVSQAASSLIELIDRVLRESFDHRSVLAWIEEELSDTPGLVYQTDKGESRPTKRGEVLCLIYGGGSVNREATEDDDGFGPSMIHKVLAGVVVSARTSLQQIKHADDEGEEDREKLMGLMSAVEGALMLGLLLQQFLVSPKTVLETADRRTA